MPNRCGTFIITDIPDAKIGEVLAGLNATIPTPEVSSEQNPADHSWTVKAKYPPCKDGSPETKSQKFSG